MVSELQARLARQQEKIEAGQAASDASDNYRPRSFAAGMDPELRRRLDKQHSKTLTGEAVDLPCAAKSNFQADLDPQLASWLAKQRERAESGGSPADVTHTDSTGSSKLKTSIHPELAARLKRQQEMMGDDSLNITFTPRKPGHTVDEQQANDHHCKSPDVVQEPIDESAPDRGSEHDSGTDHSTHQQDVDAATPDHSDAQDADQQNAGASIPACLEQQEGITPEAQRNLLSEDAQAGDQHDAGASIPACLEQQDVAERSGTAPADELIETNDSAEASRTSVSEGASDISTPQRVAVRTTEPVVGTSDISTGQRVTAGSTAAVVGKSELAAGSFPIAVAGAIVIVLVALCLALRAT